MSAARAAGLALTILAAPALAQSEEIQLIEGCVWKQQTVGFNGKANQRLKFRYQDCDGKNATKITLSLDKDNRLVMQYENYAHPVAQFWTLKGEKPSSVIPKVAEPSIDAKEKGRCEAILDYRTRHYSYGPNAAYLEELLATEEVFAVCGTYGDTNDSIQYFISVGGVLLGFLWVGQDTPLYDPDSFMYENKDKPGVAE
jgi:hypothetical protein